MDALSEISRIDYTVIFARDMPLMRQFYSDVLGFKVRRELGPSWVEYGVGDTTLALTERGMMFEDEATPSGALSVQLAFRVSEASVAVCSDSLKAKGVSPIGDVEDQPWGHRTLFFRDPDGNVLEIYAEI